MARDPVIPRRMSTGCCRAGRLLLLIQAGSFQRTRRGDSG